MKLLSLPGLPTTGGWVEASAERGPAVAEPGLTIRLLGGVAANIGDEPVDIGPGKCQAVLAALALSAGLPVTLARLVELVWGTEPPASAERTLQSYIARLRRSLGSDSITRHGRSYRLEVPPDSVDVVRFEHHLDGGRVDEALAEWTGPPLDGLEAPGLAATVTALNERWMGALEIDLGRRVEDDPAGVIGRLTELTAQNPFREGLWALLMTALYRSGRQADALAAFQSAHHHLVEELGLEPGPRLRQLEAMILGHHEDLQSGHTPGRRPSGTVTFGFGEIEHASALWADDPSAMGPALARYHEIVQATAADHGGYPFTAADHRFGVAFPRPESAVAWAGSFHQAVSDEPWPAGLCVRARVGISTGAADEHQGRYYGPPVNLAGRLAGIGHGGQTLVAATTAGLLKGEDLRELGVFRLDGVVTEQRLHQLGSIDHPPLRTERHRRGNTPRNPAPLIGRDDLVVTIVDALDRYPLVTLVGPGGIGKTCLGLATAAGRRDLDEAWLIELAEIRSDDALERMVADTLGIQDRPSGTLTSAISDALRDRSALLVLDNCEHLVDAAAALASAIIEQCPDVRLLATSRERLGISNERVLTVTPLEPSSTAVELFTQRAIAIADGFDPVADRADIEAICRRLAGIPLAIELAAARTTSLTTAELRRRLDLHRSLRLLGNNRTSSDRHRTLLAAIQWSYDLLTPPEQNLFQRLSIFTSGFDLAAAEAVATDETVDAVDVDRLLGNLVDQSMLTVESGPFGRRFRILEPIHDFGTDRLTESGRAPRIADRHTRWCLSQVTEIGNQLAGWDEIEGVARLDELWPNLRTAIDRSLAAGDRQLACQLVRPILGEIVLRGNAEIGDWIERILAITPPDDHDTIVFGLYWAAHRYTVAQNPAGYQLLVDRHGEPDHVLVKHGRAFVTGDYQGQADWSSPAGAELRRRGDHHLAERTDINLATALLNLGRHDEQEALASRLVDRYRAQGPPTYLNWSLMQLGYNALFQGRPDTADGYFNQAIEIEIPPRTHSPNRPLEARRAFRHGHHDQAFRILRAHIDDIVATDNIQAGLLVCIEFVNMMATVDRPGDAALLVEYLETTGLLDNPAWRTLIADAIVSASASPTEDDRGGLDHHLALQHMATVLGHLTGDPGSAA